VPGHQAHLHVEHILPNVYFPGSRLAARLGREASKSAP
jgi:hypothetical protein